MFVFQAPLMAPASQSEDVLDLVQVTLQEAPLPPPIQRVMDPGQFRYAVVLGDDDMWHECFSLASHCLRRNLISRRLVCFSRFL